MSKIGTVKKIIIHCSDSDWADAKAINEWHLERGWDGIGYHYVILNGHRQVARPYEAADDGLLEIGRPLDTQGAHVKGHNHDSVGICLIGRRHFSGAQLFDTLPKLVLSLLKRFDLKVEDVVGHKELNKKKTCPCLPMNEIRNIITQKKKEN